MSAVKKERRLKIQIRTYKCPKADFIIKGNFSPDLSKKIPALGEIETTQFKNGLEDGEMTSKNKDGQLLEKRYFKKGLKEGIHRAWFPNGNNRLYSEFRSGKYIYDRWEWHDNNRPFIYEKFDENGKLLVSKKWNRSGQIFMNTVIAKDGSSIGLPGSKICEPIKSPD
ncbi:MORN repeat protein [Leptospira interrogans serovar Bataviae str. HAI135]|nr:MORN repeat protein [Leptospira interrogans serovar Bataviae str. HAI135]